MKDCGGVSRKYSLQVADNDLQDPCHNLPGRSKFLSMLVRCRFCVAGQTSSSSNRIVLRTRSGEHGRTKRIQMMKKLSKAATIVEPGRIEVREYEIPPLPDGGLLLKVEMSGICGTDKHTYCGETTQYGGTVNEQTSPFPLIPGHENVGIIAEVSPGTTDFHGQPLHEGDRITMCPDVVCGRCHCCRNIFAYSWCEKWRGYGNSFRADQQPLMGG